MKDSADKNIYFQSVSSFRANKYLFGSVQVLNPSLSSQNIKKNWYMYIYHFKCFFPIFVDNQFFTGKVGKQIGRNRPKRTQYKGQML